MKSVIEEDHESYVTGKPVSKTPENNGTLAIEWAIISDSYSQSAMQLGTPTRAPYPPSSYHSDLSTLGTRDTTNVPSLSVSLSAPDLLPQELTKRVEGTSTNAFGIFNTFQPIRKAVTNTPVLEDHLTPDISLSKNDELETFPALEETDAKQVEQQYTLARLERETSFASFVDNSKIQSSLNLEIDYKDIPSHQLTQATIGTSRPTVIIRQHARSQTIFGLSQPHLSYIERLEEFFTTANQPPPQSTDICMRAIVQCVKMYAHHENRLSEEQQLKELNKWFFRLNAEWKKAHPDAQKTICHKAKQVFFQLLSSEKEGILLETVKRRINVESEKWSQREAIEYTQLGCPTRCVML